MESIKPFFGRMQRIHGKLLHRLPSGRLTSFFHIRWRKHRKLLRRLHKLPTQACKTSQ